MMKPSVDAVIAVLPGDGVGPEVCIEAVKVLRAVGRRFQHRFTLEEGLIGGAGLQAVGSPLPDATLALCRRSQAVLLGSVGGPTWEDAPVPPEQGVLALRRALGLYASLRLVRVLPQLVDASPLRPELLHHLDILVVRELSGGPIADRGSRTSLQACDTHVYSASQVERVVRLAGRMAAVRRGRLTSVDKVSLLQTSRLWREVSAHLIAQEFPELQLRHMLVDTAAMTLMLRPAEFDVIVTDNLFGDILSDQASMLAGSRGLSPSAALGDGTVGLYEPSHGALSEVAGSGTVNPYAAMLAVAQMLRHSFALAEEANEVERAVGAALAEGARTADLGGRASTAAAGNAVVAHLC